MKGDKDRVEFNELAKAVFPKWLYWLTMIILIANFQATNISSIVVSAQTMDNTLLGACVRARVHAAGSAAVAPAPALLPPLQMHGQRPCHRLPSCMRACVSASCLAPHPPVQPRPTSHAPCTSTPPRRPAASRRWTCPPAIPRRPPRRAA